MTTMAEDVIDVTGSPAPMPSVQTASSAWHRQLNIFSLPREIHLQIQSYLTVSDTKQLLLVSRAFRDIYVEQLYYNLRTAPDPTDEIDGTTDLSSMARLLSTLATSDYDYASHMRHLCLHHRAQDCHFLGVAVEQYQGMRAPNILLDTLLLLALRRAKNLKSFTWDLYINISVQVYKALQQMDTLTDVQIRAYHPARETRILLHSNHYSAQPVLKRTSVPGPVTLSGFKNLRCFSFTEINSLDIITEIKACVRNSASTLNELRLSFSESLRRARQTPTVGIAARPLYDINEDSLYGELPTETKKQDAALARIFDLEPYVLRSKVPETKPRFKLTLSTGTPVPKFLQPPQTSTSFSQGKDVDEKNSLDAADYVDNITHIEKKVPAATQERGNCAMKNGELGHTTPHYNTLTMTETSTAFNPPEKWRRNLAAQAINIKLLRARLSVMENLASEYEERARFLQSQAGPDVDAGAVASMEEQSQILHRESVNLAHQMHNVSAELLDLGRQKRVEWYAEETGEIDSVEVHGAKGTNGSHGVANGYVESAHGLCLEDLALQSIPVHASVLARAINIHTLRSLTLLDVGNQVPFWSLLHKVNKLQPLALCSLHTDAVSRTFLSLARSLNKVTDLHLRERNPVSQGSSLAPFPEVTMSDIRRQVLHKHASHLVTLSIRNEISQVWDLDRSTVRVLSLNQNLRELAVNIKRPFVHKFMDYLHYFSSLRALHFIEMSSDDDTPIHEDEELVVKQVIADTLVLHHHLDLKYLAINSSVSVSRIKRIDNLPGQQEGRAIVPGNEENVETNAHIRPNVRKYVNAKIKEAREVKPWTEEAAANLANIISHTNRLLARWGMLPEDGKQEVEPISLQLDDMDMFLVPGIQIFSPTIVNGRL